MTVFYPLRLFRTGAPTLPAVAGMELNDDDTGLVSLAPC